MKIISSLDVESKQEIRRIVDVLAGDERVAGYKIGFVLGLRYGLEEIVDLIKSRDPDKTIMYDHQKGGTDIPDVGVKFATTLSRAGIDTAILFPLSGPATLASWIDAFNMANITAIVGGYMTHPKFTVGEGGYIADNAATWGIYRDAVNLGVRSFVMPGNKKEVTQEILMHVSDALLSYRDSDDHLPDGVADQKLTTVYCPGFKFQGGNIQEMDEIFGNKNIQWYPIVGRAIYQADNPRKAVDELLGNG